jgi:membrane-bound serine protease (ClpP class)
MQPVHLVILLAVIGVVLLVAELLLPTHGVLGVIGLIAIVGAIGVCFSINQWLGLGVFIGSVIVSPFVANFALHLWPRTYVGRRILLPDVDARLTAPPVVLGQMGVCVSDLRPMGECEFGGYRLEAISEHGIIGAGSKVKVVSIASDKPTVRAMT